MPRDKEHEILRGKPASKGVVVGVCRVVDDNEEKKMKIQPGEIMVTTRTTPDDTIYMKKAAAFITNSGGSLSHTGIIAREMGVPAVVGTGEATSVLKDGQKVIVDGHEGAVYEFLPGDEHLEKPIPKPGPKPAPAPAKSLLDSMVEAAAKSGRELPPGFLEKMKHRE